MVVEVRLNIIIISTTLKPPSQTNTGTVGYRAPELIGSRIWRYQQSRGSLTAGLSQHSDVSDHSGASPTSSPGRRLESHTSLRNLAESVVGGSPTSAASRKKRDHYDRAVDVFSFGVVMYELFTRKRAFRDEAERRWKSRQQKVFPWQVDHIVTTGYRPRIAMSSRNRSVDTKMLGRRSERSSSIW